MRVTLRGNVGEMAKTHSVGKMLLAQGRLGAEEMRETWIHLTYILEIKSLGFTKGRL